MKLTKLFLIIIIHCCFLSISLSQGLLFDDNEYETLPRQPDYGDGGKGEEKALEGIYKIDLKSYCPSIQHQGQISSCVGWATGYGAYSIQQAIQNNWKNDKQKITQNAFSAMFIFNQIKINDCYFGSKINEALDLLQQKGNVHSKDFDTDTQDCERAPSQQDLNRATQFRIKDYMTLFSPKDNKRTKVNKTKLSLVQNKPVVIAMMLKQNFAKIKRGKKFWIPQIGDQKPFGGHTMVVVGFDEGKGAFEIMNSWGKGWGNEGFIWVKYDDFAQYCKYAFQLSLHGEKYIAPITETVADKNIKKEKPPTQFSNSKLYSGEIAIRKPVMRIQDSIVFSTEQLSRRENHYELEKGSFEKGTVFQLVLKNITAQSYIYVFSIDPDKKINVHWPRNEAMNKKFEGKYESAIISVPEIELKIPGKYSGLKVNNVGKESIFIIQSTQPIPDFNTRLKRISKNNSVEKSVRKVFADLLTDELVNLKEQPAKFRSKLREGKAFLVSVEILVE